MERRFQMRALVVGWLLVASDAAASPYAGADPYVPPDTFVGVDSLATLGLGLAIDHESSEPAANYDYTLRIGKVFRATDFWRPGGFFEIHSFDLETFDAALGPQVQLRLGQQLALQLRGGVGVGGDGMHVLGGVHFGTPYVGLSVTTRRAFDSDDVVVSANLEFLALVPVALAIALGAKD